MSLRRTFSNAFRGLWNFLSTETNNRIHLPVAALVIMAGIFFQIDATEWLFIILAIGLVLTSEAFNSSMEKLCDKVDSAYNKEIKTIKDISAGAVLISSIIAVGIGLIIFLPKLSDLLL
jgi:diacylglycerol kinase